MTKNIINREDLVKKVKELITPNVDPQGYPLIIGEHGTGKTSLLWLAVKDMKTKPRGIVYADVLSKDDSPLQLSEAIEKALGLNPSKCN